MANFERSSGKGSNMLVDLEYADYIRLTDRISRKVRQAEDGEHIPLGHGSVTYAAIGSMNEGGYDSVPSLESSLPLVYSGLRAAHSYDIEYTEDETEEGAQSDLRLRVYNDTSSFEIARYSNGEAFVPHWSVTLNGRVLDAESPYGDHAIMTTEDIKAALWALTHSTDSVDYSLLQPDTSLRDAACAALVDANASARTFITSKTYRSEEFDERDDSADMIPGSSLKVTHVELQKTESIGTSKTEYILTYVLPEIGDSPQKTDIPIWLVYTFVSVVHDDSGAIERTAAGVDVVLKDPLDELFVTDEWLRNQQLEQQVGTRQDFPRLMYDALDTMFEKR